MYLPDAKNLLDPPTSVRGMKSLERNAFLKTIRVPFIRLASDTNTCVKVLKSYLLKMDRIKPVQECDQTGKKDFILNPVIVRSLTDLNMDAQDQLKQLGLTEFDFQHRELTLTYENWKADAILKAILPLEAANVTGFSIVGHIIHLNLKDDHLEYKHIIGSVLLDKIHNARTVVNKLSVIDNTYRNFSMEVLAGDQDMHVSVKENGCHFKFDFAKVYWNPRLATEHARIVAKLGPNDTLFDVFAGVGPFSIPAGRRKCRVYANDLNPESTKWLNHNAEKNKVSEKVSISTLDGRTFLREVVREKLLEIWRSDDVQRGIHIVMNLPAVAAQFLDVFPDLCGGVEVDTDKAAFALPFVHCYCFVKDEDDSKGNALSLVETHLGYKLLDSPPEVAFVRNVSPKKDMMRVSFQLPAALLFGVKAGDPPPKKIKMDK